MKPQSAKPKFNAPLSQGQPKSAKVQREEQRSIAVYSELEGAHSLPFEPIDITVYSKADEEKAELATLKSSFVGTLPWVEQHGRRLGHIAVANQKRHNKGIVPKITTRSYFRELRKNADKNFFDSLVIN